MQDLVCSGLGQLVKQAPSRCGPNVPHLTAPALADRMSYDFVLRKKGKWEPFSQEFPAYPTGRGLYCSGKFIGPPNMAPPKGDEAIPCPSS